MERLQKVIANSGYCSRRKAEELINQGKVMVNGNIIREQGVKVSGNDIIKCIKIDKVIINNKEYHNLLLGIIDNISMDGIDIILNNKMEDI